ncbi:galactose oxidase [Pelomyxa schiedti]|nr:galactose oxidase [Pelomyxa schiedti]
MAWTRPSCSGVGPGPRCGHTINVCGGMLWMFAGFNGSQLLNEVTTLRLATMRWDTPEITGNAPVPRSGHTTTTVGQILYVFGGGAGSSFLNDVHLLDVGSLTWTQAYVAGTSPAARSRHTTVLAGKSLIVFGGGDDSRLYNDTYVLDIDTMAWSRPAVSGSPPTPRWGHTAALVGDKMLIFGGHDGGKMLNDLYELDTVTLSWSQVAKIDGDEPSPRAGHTMSTLDSKLVLFGGSDGGKTLNDVYFLDTSFPTCTWMKSLIVGAAPTGRCTHTATLCENGFLVVFGGGNGTRLFKELYFLDLGRVLRDIEAKQQHQAKKTVIKKPVAPPAVKVRDPTHYTSVGQWLHQLGLDGLTPQFVREEVTLEALPFITEHHLETLGVISLGARLKLLSAISRLQQTTQTPAPANQPATSATLPINTHNQSTQVSTQTDTDQPNPTPALSQQPSSACVPETPPSDAVKSSSIPPQTTEIPHPQEPPCATKEAMPTDPGSNSTFARELIDSFSELKSATSSLDLTMHTLSDQLAAAIQQQQINNDLLPLLQQIQTLTQAQPIQTTLPPVLAVNSNPQIVTPTPAATQHTQVQPQQQQATNQKRKRNRKIKPTPNTNQQPAPNNP